MAFCYRHLVVCVGMLSLATAIVVADDDDQSPVAAAPSSAGLESAYSQVSAEYESIKPIFKSGCFDCHSDQTSFPWYHSLPIIKGWLDEHIAEARDELDFSLGFPFSGKGKRPADKLYKIKGELEEGAMPLWSYRIMHWGAAPNDEEKDSIYAWIDRSLILLGAHGQYPFGKPENVPGAK